MLDRSNRLGDDLPGASQQDPLGYLYDHEGERGLLRVQPRPAHGNRLGAGCNKRHQGISCRVYHSPHYKKGKRGLKSYIGKQGL